jgi:hypothetical protein
MGRKLSDAIFQDYGKRVRYIVVGAPIGDADFEIRGMRY